MHKARGLVQRPLEPRSAVTRRQVDILRLAANGNTNSAIAHWLGISEETVKSQLRAIYPKLRVSDRTQAVAVALRVGLLSVDDIDLPHGLLGRPGQRHT
ncbi:LuxR C-terminal-related transcriptional regulator [Streptomyces venezuelae]|uniref:LuxR C-terminal-related transcriptional regulator n=1 Tax=Streptomyces venezuelae TaxID=54571 RepID=UPI003453EFA5